MSTRQKRWLIISSSLVLALVQLGVILFLFFQKGLGAFYYTPLRPILLFLGAVFFLIPFQISMYITYRTNNAQEGSNAGGIVGCMGALLSVLLLMVAAYLGMLAGEFSGNNGLLTVVGSLYAIFCFFGFLLALLGTTLGSLLGKIPGRRRVP